MFTLHLLMLNSSRVQTYSNMLKHVQTCSNILKHVSVIASEELIIRIEYFSTGGEREENLSERLYTLAFGIFALSLSSRHARCPEGHCRGCFACSSPPGLQHFPNSDADQSAAHIYSRHSRPVWPLKQLLLAATLASIMQLMQLAKLSLLVRCEIKEANQSHPCRPSKAMLQLLCRARPAQTKA